VKTSSTSWHCRAALLATDLPQHPDEQRSERPILLAVDQQLGEGSARGSRCAGGWGPSPSTQSPILRTGVRLGGEDLSREVRRRTHDEADTTAFDLETSPISGIRVNPVGVPARRAGGGSGIGWRDGRGHAATVGRVGGRCIGWMGTSASVESPRRRPGGAEAAAIGRPHAACRPAPPGASGPPRSRSKRARLYGRWQGPGWCVEPRPLRKKVVSDARSRVECSEVRPTRGTEVFAASRQSSWRRQPASGAGSTSLSRRWSRRRSPQPRGPRSSPGRWLSSDSFRRVRQEKPKALVDEPYPAAEVDLPCYRLSGLPQHADEHGPKRSILLAVDQQLGEGAARRSGSYSPTRFGTSEWAAPKSHTRAARASPAPRQQLRQPRSSTTSASSSIPHLDLRPTRRPAPTQRARPRTPAESGASTCSYCLLSARPHSLAASQPGQLLTSAPPRSRSRARRRSDSAGSSSTRRSGRPARGRGASGRGATRRLEPARGRRGASVVGAQACRVSRQEGYAVELSARVVGVPAGRSSNQVRRSKPCRDEGMSSLLWGTAGRSNCVPAVPQGPGGTSGLGYIGTLMVEGDADLVGESLPAPLGPFRRGRWPMGMEPGGRGIGIDRRGNHSAGPSGRGWGSPATGCRSGAPMDPAYKEGGVQPRSYGGWSPDGISGLTDPRSM